VTAAVAPRSAPAGVLEAPLADADLDLLLLIRHFEQGLLDLFAAGLVGGTTHSCLGQEYIPVALRTLLRGDDYVFSNHRGHGHYLALFDDPAGLLAEILGREGAVCGGVGGSQHIHRDRYLSTGVQGESLPVAAGAALHLKRAGRGGLAAVFVGDGTFGEGTVYETLNMAQLWRLPLLVLVENNHIAQSTPSSANMAGTVAGRAAAFGVMHRGIVTTDIGAIRGELAPLINTVRQQSAPLIVEFDTVRLGPHSKGDDTRDPESREQARARDWYQHYAAALGERLTRADARQRARVAEIIRAVRERPPARWEA
jgi:acetoin:2,6-dichlorophenolindophenol oxidoreductase subunit alpha